MKKLSLLLVALTCAATSFQAQNVSIKLTSDQYNQIKSQVLRNYSNEDGFGRDWANFGRYDEANKTIKEKPRVVFMGNSITEIWYSTHAAFFNEHHFAGRGISGQTSAEMLVRFRTDVINLHPKFVIINAGTNDIAHNNGEIKLENILGNIISMTELAKANQIRPILSSVLPSNHMRWRPQVSPADSIIKLNKMIKAYADRNGYKYIDYYSALVNEEKGLPEKYSKDGVHPTMDGYSIMEGLVLKALK